MLSMFVDPQMQELVAKYNCEYVHWEELRHRKLPVEAKQMWALIKSSRALQAKRVEFAEWTFRYVLSGDTLRRLHLLDTKGAGIERDRSECCGPEAVHHQLAHGRSHCLQSA